MTKRYVLFRKSSLNNTEWYLAPDGSSVETLIKNAMSFPNARSAYEFGERNWLDEWRVGVREI